MPGYRVEVSGNARAICKNKECKDAGVKIQKGEYRFGSLVDIQGHVSWTYKHWGCVTPQQIGNLIEFTSGDTELVDGYDEIPPEFQEKVKFALENGHVPDEDWKGDVEVNRPGQKGFRAKAPKTPKKGKKAVADEDSADEEPKAKKKRVRPVMDDVAEAPAPKKAKGKAKKAAKEEDEKETPVSEVEVEEPKPKKGKKATSKKQTKKEVDQVPGGEPEEVAPKAKRGRKKATATASEEKPAPQKRGRKKKVATKEE